MTISNIISGYYLEFKIMLSRVKKRQKLVVRQKNVDVMTSR